MVPIDLASAESIKQAFAKAAKEFGRIDILVNNAGITRDGLALRMKKDDWDAVLAANLTGAFLAIQQVLHGMMKERWGRIINISSVVAEAGNPGQANYVASKAGLDRPDQVAGAGDGQPQHHRQRRRARLHRYRHDRGAFPQELKDNMLSHIPLRRFGKPDDVAAAVRFLASEEAGYITGHVLDVNGGMYM